MKRAAVAAVVVLLLYAAISAWRLVAYLDAPLGGERKVALTVGPGDTLRPVLRRLKKDEVLDRPGWLYLYARLQGKGTIRAGTYEITAAQAPRDILATLVEGRVKLERFTVPEGYNRWQVRDLLVQHGWLSAQEFDRLCDDAAFLQEHRVPGPSCEGYLFPETYTFARGVEARVILGDLFAAFHKSFAAATRQGRGPLALTDRELVTLASIVEKETGAPQERPRIACVFYNRLRAKPAWRMETDPTVIYAATLADPAFDGNIKRSHLRAFDHPYNTYKIYGLPPGPIANPGRAAFDAVVTPAACGDFFFVSMNNGLHVFCPTLDCHNKAVQQWQVDYFRRR